MRNPRQIFVSEYLTSGACPSPVDSSLRAEGEAMLIALLRDLLSMPDVSVSTTWDSRLGAPPAVIRERSDQRLSVHVVSDPPAESLLFLRLVSESDYQMIIAPECDGILLDRVGRLKPSESLNCDLDAIELCSDKLRLAQWCLQHDIPTPPTSRFSDDRCDHLLPMIVKPADGAGACDTFIIKNESDRRRFKVRGSISNMICQPFIEGTHLSVGAIIGADGVPLLLPVVRQRISFEGNEVRYRGGRLDQHESESHRTAAHTLVSRVIESMSGLRGYIGFDLLIENGSRTVTLIEINPRLTTSFVGYQALSNKPLWNWMLTPAQRDGVTFSDGCCEFDPDGTTRMAD